MTRRSEGHQASIGLDAAQGPLVATYQTRISDYGDMVRAGGDATLSAYAELYGYGSHEEWLSEWRDARSDEFFVLGSRFSTLP